jgi:hypothetical protein
LTLIISKKINYFSNEALIKDWINYHRQIRVVAATTKNLMSGFWVGGICDVHSEKLVISASSINQKIHKNLSRMEIEFSDIEDLILVKKLTTDIIIVNFSETSLKIRCWGAESFMAEILLQLQNYKKK